MKFEPESGIKHEPQQLTNYPLDVNNLKINKEYN